MTTLSMDVNGVSVTIESELFLENVKESNRILDDIESLKIDHKDLVEAMADATKLEKKDVRSYLKAKYKAATKEPKAQGVLFEALDGVLEN